MGLKKKPEPGTKVRLTGVFLRNTGQHTGDEGRKRWTVQPRGYEDVTPEVRAKMFRHIACGNLEIVGAKPKAEDYP